MKNMKKIKEILEFAVVKCGPIIACCAFAFASITANSPCMLAYYEPEEPKGLERLKKYN